jgi:hypothetical protein
MNPIKPPVDLHDYQSTIKRADGTVPYNGYLWPTEDWWPSHTSAFMHINSRYRLKIIALNDGRFATNGMLCCIEQNTDHPYPHKDDKPGRPVVFPDRITAIRTSAARMIQDIRRYGSYDHLTRATMSALINWTLNIVAKQCGEPDHKSVSLPIPVPMPEKTGLELLDYINQKDFETKIHPRPEAPALSPVEASAKQAIPPIPPPQPDPDRPL